MGPITGTKHTAPNSFIPTHPETVVPTTGIWKRMPFEQRFKILCSHGQPGKHVLCASNYGGSSLATAVLSLQDGIETGPLVSLPSLFESRTRDTTQNISREKEEGGESTGKKTARYGAFPCSPSSEFEVNILHLA